MQKAPLKPANSRALPGRGPAPARGAGRVKTDPALSEGRARERAEASRRPRGHPRQDRGARHQPDRAPRRRRPRHGRREGAAPRPAACGRHGAEPDELIIQRPKPVDVKAERQVVRSRCASCRWRTRSSPRTSRRAAEARPRSTSSANWELIEPLFRAFEYGAGGGSASMRLPESTSLATPGKLELMRHQARFVEEVKLGHRTFLLADEPGLGKTAQALLAASVSHSYPLLVVVPNVVKTNWGARGGAVDAAAHRDRRAWRRQRRRRLQRCRDRELRDPRPPRRLARRFGFKGMVVDEAHFIKNLTSQRSKHVLSLSKSIRATSPKALFMALTGTPLINQIDDFRAIWQFLGWIDDKKPLPPLMDKLEDTGLTPADFGFFAEARQAVIDMGTCGGRRWMSRPTSPRVASPTSRRARRRSRRSIREAEGGREPSP
ncbi:MAG: SNF2-related protein [Galbitalea sp.]